MKIRIAGQDITPYVETESIFKWWEYRWFTALVYLSRLKYIFKMMVRQWKEAGREYGS